MNPLSYHLNSLHSNTFIPSEFPGFHKDVITDAGLLECDAAMLLRCSKCFAKMCHLLLQEFKLHAEWRTLFKELEHLK
jgi:hypothetical protein